MLERPLSRAISAILLATAFLIVAMLLLLRPGDAPVGPAIDTLVVFELKPGRSIDLAIPPDVDRIRISTHMEAPPEALEQPSWGADYDLDLTWLDHDGRTLGERRIVERSRLSRFPSQTNEPLRSSWLRDDPRIITDGRATVIPGGAILGTGGGTLRVASPAEGRTLFIRVWGEQPRDPIEAERMTLTPTQAQRRDFVRRVGVADWSELVWAERTAVARDAWLTIKPAGPDVEIAWLQYTEFAVTFQHQMIGGLVLEPHRKVAINFDGPVALRVNGPPGTNGLAWSQVSDHPPGDKDDVQPILVEAAPPIPLHGAIEARVFHFPAGTATSLTLSNETDRPVGPIILAVDNPAKSDFFGWTVGAASKDILPPEAGMDLQTVFVSPEYRFHRIFRTWKNALPIEVEMTRHPGALAMLETRFLLTDHEDRRPRHLTVTALRVDGQTAWTETIEVIPEPAPYEYRLPGIDEHLHTAGGRVSSWISEPVDLYVPDGPALDRITVSTDDDALVTPRHQGPQQGGSIYELPFGEVDVRYEWRPLRDWHRVEAINADALVAAGQLEQVAYDVRLEYMDEGGPGEASKADGVRQYASIHPTDPATVREGRIWLVTPSDTAAAGPLVCRYLANADQQPLAWNLGAAAAMNHVLEAWIWTPDLGALGKSWRIEFDGVKWRKGTMIQRVGRASANREPPHAAARFVGPEGSSAWIRTWGRPEDGCPDALRPMLFYPIEPGASITFPFQKTQSEHILVFGAVAFDATALQVDVDSGRIRRSETGLLDRYTRPSRELEFPQSASPPATALDDPDQVLPVLASRGIWIGHDMTSGAHSATVTNPTGSLVWVRAALEDAPQHKGSRVSPLRVRSTEAP